MRTDLDLTPSQLAVQAAHAFVGIFHHMDGYSCEDVKYDVQEGTKVILTVNSSTQFIALQRALSHARIPFWTAVEGPPCHPSLDGIPTALGIGPITKSTAKPILGGLRLLR